MNPLISVIIPAYNSARYIGETVRSAMNQSEKDVEIIVVDDGSTDGQNSIVEELAQQDARIKLIRQANQGVSAARNNGFKHSTGRYIAFLDSDDTWMPDNLTLKIARLQEGCFGLVHSGADVINEHSEKTGQTIHGKEGYVLNDILAWRGTQVPGPSSIVVPREVLDAVGLFDEQLSTSADMDFFIRVAAAYPIGKVDQVTWRYRIHAHNMHKNVRRMEHDILYVFNKIQTRGLFHSANFKRSCFGKTYLVLAYSWAGDGSNFVKGFYFLCKALIKDPGLSRDVATKIFKNKRK